MATGSVAPPAPDAGSTVASAVLAAATRGEGIGPRRGVHRQTSGGAMLRSPSPSNTTTVISTRPPASKLGVSGTPATPGSPHTPFFAGHAAHGDRAAGTPIAAGSGSPGDFPSPDASQASPAPPPNHEASTQPPEVEPMVRRQQSTPLLGHHRPQVRVVGSPGGPAAAPGTPAEVRFEVSGCPSPTPCQRPATLSRTGSLRALRSNMFGTSSPPNPPPPQVTSRVAVSGVATPGVPMPKVPTAGGSVVAARRQQMMSPTRSMQRDRSSTDMQATCAEGHPAQGQPLTQQSRGRFASPTRILSSVPEKVAPSPSCSGVQRQVSQVLQGTAPTGLMSKRTAPVRALSPTPPPAQVLTQVPEPKVIAPHGSCVLYSRHGPARHGVTATAQARPSPPCTTPPAPAMSWGASQATSVPTSVQKWSPAQAPRLSLRAPQPGVAASR